MYPQKELKRLARTKALLHARIAGARADCTEAAERVFAPVRKGEELWAGWKRIAPLAKFAAIPAAFLLKRRLLRGSKLAWLVRAAPAILSVVRTVHHRRTHA